MHIYGQLQPVLADIGAALLHTWIDIHAEQSQARRLQVQGR